MNRLRPLVLAAIAVLAAVSLTACGNKKNEERFAANEGIYFESGDLKYQVQITRQLNPKQAMDSELMQGIAPAQRLIKPDELWFATFLRVENESGSTQHLAGELFKLSAGLDMVHIPYKGGAQAQADVAGGQAELTFNVVPSALPLVRAGKLRALAVAGKTRSEAMPEVPTMIEAGYPGFSAFTWNGILAPAGTPREIVTKLHDALVGALKTPEMKEQLAKIGQESAWSNTPDEFIALIREETEKWRRVIPAAGLKAQ